MTPNETQDRDHAQFEIIEKRRDELPSRWHRDNGPDHGYRNSEGTAQHSEREHDVEDAIELHACSLPALGPRGKGGTAGRCRVIRAPKRRG